MTTNTADIQSLDGACTGILGWAMMNELDSLLTDLRYSESEMVSDTSAFLSHDCSPLPSDETALGTDTPSIPLSTDDKHRVQIQAEAHSSACVSYPLCACYSVQLGISFTQLSRLNYKFLTIPLLVKYWYPVLFSGYKESCNTLQPVRIAQWFPMWVSSGFSCFLLLYLTESLAVIKI